MKRKAQAPIDHFFKRTVTSKRTGTITMAYTVRTQLDNKKLCWNCCSKSFGNAGALAVHMKMVHPDVKSQKNKSSFFSQPIPKKKKTSLAPIKKISFAPILAAITFNAVCLSTQMTVLPLKPLEFEPVTFEKIDGRKKNKGSAKRRQYDNLFKAKVIDEYYTASEEDRTISQDDFALSQGLGGQSILCTWLKQKDKIMEAAADLKKRGLF